MIHTPLAQMTKDDVAKTLKLFMGEIAAANERNGNLCVELAAMRQSRNAADDECTRLSVELAAVKLERDGLRRGVADANRGAEVNAKTNHILASKNAELRREVAALVPLTGATCPSGPRATKCRRLRGMGTVTECQECITEWAKQQAAQAGKDVTK